MRKILWLAFLLVLSACATPATPVPTIAPTEIPVIPTSTATSTPEVTAMPVVLGTAFVVKYDDTIAVELKNSQALEIQFLSLLDDSRCPSNVICAWAGNAKVVIRVWTPGAPFKDFELNTHPDFPGYADYLQYRITLLDVHSTADDKFRSNLPYDAYSLELTVAEHVP